MVRKLYIFNQRTHYYIGLLYRFTNYLGDAFQPANRMLVAMASKWLQKGGQIKHYAAIKKQDLQLLTTYFDRTNAVKLQDEVLFNIMYVFGERGREHLNAFVERGLF